MPQWMQDLVSGWPMIRANLVTFILIVAAIIGAVWFVFSMRYSDIISTRDSTIQSLEARIKLRDDQLADKLHSTPTNEAQAIIKGLQDRIDKIAPRRVDASKRSLLAEKLKLPAGSSYQIEITHDGACSDCNLFAADFSTLFSESGWAVRNGMVIGPGRIPATGIGIIAPNPSALSIEAKTVIAAMSAAEIKFNLQQGPLMGANVGLLITAKTN